MSKLKKWLWAQYLKMWPGSDKVIILQRFNPYSEYVTIYDKWLFNRLLWHYTQFTDRVWPEKKHNFLEDLKYTLALLKEDNSHFERLRKIYERIS